MPDPFTRSLMSKPFAQFVIASCCFQWLNSVKILFDSRLDFFFLVWQKLIYEIAIIEILIKDELFFYGAEALVRRQHIIGLIQENSGWVEIDLPLIHALILLSLTIHDESKFIRKQWITSWNQTKLLLPWFF